MAAEKTEKAQPEQAEAPQADPLAALEAEYSEFDADTFTREIRGITVTYRTPKDATDVIRKQKQVARLNKAIANGTAQANWKPFLPIDPLVFGECYFVTQYVTNPQISLVKAMDWAKNKAMLLHDLFLPIAPFINSMAEESEEEILEDLGNE